MVTQHYISSLMDKNQKRYASINHPTIAAVVHEMYRFTNEEDARACLEMLRQHFIPSKQQIPNASHPSLHLWIKGYAVSEDDKAQGGIGHFAVITYREMTGKWQLYATKLDTPIKLHPQRAQVKRDNPNWGHPVMRAIRKGKVYPTMEAAQAELNLLHEQFPRVSIPNPGKLYIMIYCADRLAKERMVKHVLKIELNQDAKYLIECKENIPKIKRSEGKSPKTPPPIAPGPEPVAPQGMFTAKVALRRARKGKKG